MSRIRACPVAAKVVALKILGNLPDEILISEAVCKFYLSFVPEPPIPSLVNRRQPTPAAIRAVLIDLVPKALRESLGGHLSYEVPELDVRLECLD